MSITMINCDELRNRNMISLENTKASGLNGDFWYYTSANTADLILRNKCFHVRNIKAMNDINEANIHKNDAEMIHALCFCNSSSEKIPMWYLYAGLTGQGISLGLTASKMVTFINSITSVQTVTDSPIDLIVGEDVEIQCGFIYYRKPTDHTAIKYRNVWYKVTDVDSFERGNNFIKDYPWEYEKEFRIVILNRTGKAYEKLKISIRDELIDQLKIKLAPELSEEDVFKILDMEGFKSYLSSKLLRSDLGIKMDLFNRNKEDAWKYITRVLEDMNDNEYAREVETICSTIHEHKRCRIQ